MLHTVGMRQSVILTRKNDYASFCQGGIMSFQSTMLLGVVLLGVTLLVVMLHFTTPPKNHKHTILAYCSIELRSTRMGSSLAHLLLD